MRKIVCVSFLSALLFCGCSDSNKSSIFIPKVKEQDYAHHARPKIVPTKLDYCPMGVNDVVSISKYLIFTTNDASGYIRIYDIEKNAEVASILKKGRAANELTAGRPYNLSEQVYSSDGDIMFPVIDNTTLKEINITQSIKEGVAVINASTPCLFLHDGNTVLIDNDISKTFIFQKAKMHDGECDAPEFYVQQAGGEKKIIPVHKRVMPDGDGVNVEVDVELYAQYMGSVFKHPKKNIIVHSLQNMNYLIFFDLDNDKCFAVHQKGERTYDDKVEYVPEHMVFGDAAVSEDYIFINYRYNITAGGESDIECEVLAFDWNGNYVGGFVSDATLHRLTYNEECKSLFCVSINDETLYQIPIKDFLK